MPAVSSFQFKQHVPMKPVAEGWRDAACMLMQLLRTALSAQQQGMHSKHSMQS
jgi:hypothetical protein